MYLFVDTEHISGYDKPSGKKLMAARTAITYKLEDLLHDDVHLIRYNRLDEAAVERLAPKAIFFSGSSSVPDDFGAGEQDGAQRVIRDTPLPMFGFCGGMQLIGLALGVPPTKLGRLAEGEEDPYPMMSPGWKKEGGYFEIELLDDHPLTADLGAEPIFRHAHSWEVATLPEGFRNLASTPLTDHQLIVNDRRHIVGSQFHPEYWTDEHPAGAAMIRNFCEWADVS